MLWNGIRTIAPKENYPPVSVRVWVWVKVSFRVGGKFSSLAIVLESFETCILCREIIWLVGLKQPSHPPAQPLAIRIKTAAIFNQCFTWVGNTVSFYSRRSWWRGAGALIPFSVKILNYHLNFDGTWVSGILYYSIFYLTLQVFFMKFSNFKILKHFK